MKLGVIADDFTGATDIAGFLVENGIRTVQTTGIPAADFPAEAEAYVVSLKSRSCPADEAVALSLQALAWLRGRGCTQVYFKYCSTFDSTAEGNIGPVTDALLEALGADMTVICPALPVNGRTVYKGYLFVHDQLLSESGMKDHPLNPMRDSRLSRLMDAQAAGKTGSVYSDVVDRGADAIREKLRELGREGYRYAVLDTLTGKHLDEIGLAVRDFALVTGGSGLAVGLAKAEGRSGDAVSAAQAAGRPASGKTVVLAGSCSTATNRQVDRYRSANAALFLDPARCLNDPDYLDELYAWTVARLQDGPAPLLYATTTADELARNRAAYGAAGLGEAIEKLFGDLAVRLRDAGVRNFIVAGGETSGKVVQSLGLKGFHIGPQIDPGVPWVKAVDNDLYLALKSGNFGSDDFFEKAQEFFR